MELKFLKIHCKMGHDKTLLKSREAKDVLS